MNTIQYIIRPSPVTTIQAGTGADPLREAQAQNIEILQWRACQELIQKLI